MEYKVSKEVLRRAKGIRLLAMDVDGVLTGGEIIILESGEELKVWSVKDRMGFALLKHSGLKIKTAWITARQSVQVARRAKEIEVDFLFQNCLNKGPTLKLLMKKLKLTSEQVAYIGDDFVDLACLKEAGLAVCPPVSPRLLKNICHYETTTLGGRGAVRELIEIILEAQGAWKKTVARFAPLLLGLFMSLSLMSCSSTQTPPADFADKPDQWVEKFTITETSKGVPVWILNSEIAQVYNKQKKITLENIRIQFMNPTSVKKLNSRKSLLLAKKTITQAARLTAPKGEVAIDSRDLSAWGGVEVDAQDGTKLFAERLLYSASRQKILTESPVKIVRRDSILLGEGMEASPDLATIKIYRHQASIYPKNFPVNE